LQCAAQTHTVYVDNGPVGVNVSNERFAPMAPYYYTVARMLSERAERTKVAQLAAAGWLKPGTKVGVLVEQDAASLDGWTNALKPALAAQHAQVTEIVYPDIIESSWQNYVLQFQSAGVTNVMFATSSYGFWPATLFMKSAENQTYRPKYAITSEQGPFALLAQVSANQLANATGIGWSAAVDTGKTPSNANYKLCLQIEKAAHQASTASGIGAAVWFCDYLFFLQAGFAHATEFSPAGLQAGVNALGQTYGSVITDGVGVNAFSGGHHDGVGSVRHFAYRASCSCFQYTSPAGPSSP
jgi:hypothetical protein